MHVRRLLVSISAHLSCKKWHKCHNHRASNVVAQAFPTGTSAEERLMDRRDMVAFGKRKEEGRMSLATLVLAAALNPGGLIAWLVIGLLAGWLAGVIMPGKGFGLLGDLIIGLVGAFLGGLLINLLVPDATFGFWGSLVVALIGACILVAILHAVMASRTTAPRP